MKLIINADDFGYTKSICEGIIEGCQKGIIRSTTALTNMPYLKYGAQLAKQTPQLGIGVHLTLTLGESLTKGKTLIRDGIHFKNRKQFYEEIDQLDLEEVYQEFKAQIENFITIFHRLPDHLDSHHSVHDAGDILLISQKLAREYDLPMRRYCEFSYTTGFYGDSATVENLLDIFQKHEHHEGIELMTHPGYCDLELYRQSSYHFGRVQELDVLCDERVVKYIKEHDISLTNYTSR